MNLNERTEKRREAIRLRTEEFLSISEISSKLNIAKSTVSSYIAGISLPEDKLKEKIDIANNKSKNNKIIEHNDYKLQVKQIPLSDSFTPVQYGLLGEAFAKYKLLREGYEIFEPSVLTPSCDLLIKNNKGQYKRCEIKSSRDFKVMFQHSYHKSGGLVGVSGYDENDKIDIFIAVLLSFERIFILPSRDVISTGRMQISFSDYANNSKYENAYYYIDE